jgi:hypothetical protein
MLEILERIGNVLFWCCVPTAAFLLLISIEPGLNDHDDFGLYFGSGVAIYAAGLAARYILGGNTNWKPWRKDTYK